MVYNPVNGLFYLSVPSAAGAPYGNTVVSIDPLTGALGTPIPVGSEPNRLAVTSDGKYLWVALDGGSAVRKVDLVAGTAGLQFSIGANNITVSALAALPGEPDPLIPLTGFGGDKAHQLLHEYGIYRQWRRAYPDLSPFQHPTPLSRRHCRLCHKEPKSPGLGMCFMGRGVQHLQLQLCWCHTQFVQFICITGVTAQNNTDDVQIAGNRLYTSFGQAVDPSFVPAWPLAPPTPVAPPRHKVRSLSTPPWHPLILEGSPFGPFGGFPVTIGSSSAQLAAFNASDFTATASTPIPLTIPIFRATYQYAGPTGSHLTRWGSHGLAFRGTGGFVSLRTSLVQDISTVNADLGVSITSAGTNTGSSTVYTATVTKKNPAPAAPRGSFVLHSILRRPYLDHGIDRILPDHRRRRLRSGRSAQWSLGYSRLQRASNDSRRRHDDSSGQCLED